MTKKIRVYLFAVLLAVLALTLFAGCKLNPTLDDFINKNNLKAVVTYYANGGNFGGAATEKSLYYPEGVKPLNIGEDTITNGTINISRKDYEFAGWYYAPLGEDGLPVFNEGTNIVAASDSDTPVDFSVPLKDGDHLYVYAKWVSVEKLEIRLVTDGGADLSAIENGETVIYKNGDVLSLQSFGGQSINRFSKDPITGTINDFTFAEYYTDETCEEIVSWPIKALNGTENQVIYARYIPGKWTMLKSSSDIMRANFGLSSNKYYLLCDIDMNGAAFPAISRFACVLQGNGFTVSNAAVTVSQTVTFNKKSLFGDITESAVISDVTFENITLNVNLGRNQFPEIYLFATSVNSSAKITGVTIGGTLNITTTERSKIVANITQNASGEYDTTHWIIGGGTTDAENLAADWLSGLTVSDIKLVIDETEIPLAK